MDMHIDLISAYFWVDFTTLAAVSEIGPPQWKQFAAGGTFLPENANFLY
jgi:hypothetical protein